MIAIPHPRLSIPSLTGENVDARIFPRAFRILVPSHFHMNVDNTTPPLGRPRLSCFFLHAKSQIQRAHNTGANDGPPGDDDLLVRECGARVPDQMAQAVEAVQGEGHGEESLKTDFQGDGQGAERGGHAGGFQVPAEQRGDEVGSAEDVDRARQRAAGDTIQCGQVPRYLRSVDSQVWRDRAVEALGCEDVVACLLGDGVGGGWSVREWHVSLGRAFSMHVPLECFPSTFTLSLSLSYTSEWAGRGIVLT